MAETDKDDLISIIEDDGLEEEIPKTLPLMPVRDVVIFTDMLLPLFVGREKSVRAVEEAVSKTRFLLVATQTEPGIENPKEADIYTVGTVCKILRMLKLPDGRVKALVQGIAKARIKKYVRKRSLFRVSINILDEASTEKPDLETKALMRIIREHSEKILALRGELTGDVSAILDSIDDPVTSYLSFIPDSTKRNPCKFPFHGLGDSLTQGCLSHTRRPHETKDRSFCFLVELANTQVFQNTILDLFKSVMILVQGFFGLDNIDHVFGGFLPWYFHQPVQVGPHDTGLGRIRMHLL